MLCMGKLLTCGISSHAMGWMKLGLVGWFMVVVVKSLWLYFFVRLRVFKSEKCISSG